jgi:hypothetical protein
LPNLPVQAIEQPAALPNLAGSVRFLVIGDMGNGDREQYEVADQMAKLRARFGYTFVITVGDNIYGGESARDMERKFEKPYKPLLDSGVTFHASLGNHDNREQRFYKYFNMGGETYYTFKPEGGQSVRFFALESDNPDRRQLDWLEGELRGSGEDWKIAYFHHPLYSSGNRHGANLPLRKVLEPLFIEHNVSVVFTGHEHFYERLVPQHGIQHFIEGASGQLRRGNLARNSPLTAKGYDQDRSFMAIEIAGDEMYFQTISRTGQIVDSGIVRRRGADPKQ